MPLRQDPRCAEPRCAPDSTRSSTLRGIITPICQGCLTLWEAANKPRGGSVNGEGTLFSRCSGALLCSRIYLRRVEAVVMATAASKMVLRPHAKVRGADGTRRKCPQCSSELSLPILEAQLWCAVQLSGRKILSTETEASPQTQTLRTEQI